MLPIPHYHVQDETCEPAPKCAPYEDLKTTPIGTRGCCSKAECKCNHEKCEPKPVPKCSKHDETHVIVDEDACCKEYECRCPPPASCPNTTKPVDLDEGQVAELDPDFCCPNWIVTCKEETCKTPPTCSPHEILKVVGKGECCNITS